MFSDCGPCTQTSGCRGKSKPVTVRKEFLVFFRIRSISKFRRPIHTLFRLNLRCALLALITCVPALASTSIPMSAVCKKLPADFFLYDTKPQARSAGIVYEAEIHKAFGRNQQALAHLFGAALPFGCSVGENPTQVIASGAVIFHIRFLLAERLAL